MTQGAFTCKLCQAELTSGFESSRFGKEMMVNEFDLVISDTTERPSESVLGIGYSLLVRAEQTGGAYELMEFVVPAGAGPPPHVHRNEDEGFYLVDGEIDVLIGEQTIHAKPGTYVHLPRGVSHAFLNASGRTAAFLCWVIPGNLAGFFDAFKRPWPAGQELPAPVSDEDIGRMMAAARNYEVEILA